MISVEASYLEFDVLLVRLMHVHSFDCLWRQELFDWQIVILPT